MNRFDALNHAREMIDLFFQAGVITRAEVVGDIARGKDQIKQPEILVQPVTLQGEMKPLPGYEQYVPVAVQQFDRFTMWLDKAIDRGELRGPLSKSYQWKRYVGHKSITATVYICAGQRQWGILSTLLTSPDALAKRLGITRSSGGLLPDGWTVRTEGVLIQSDGSPVYAPTEEDFFAVLGLPFIPRGKRR